MAQEKECLKQSNARQNRNCLSLADLHRIEMLLLIFFNCEFYKSKRKQENSKGKFEIACARVKANE